MRLQLNSTTVGVDGEVDEALLIVDTGQVSMDNCMVGAKTQGSQVSSHSSETTQIMLKISLYKQLLTSHEQNYLLV